MFWGLKNFGRESGDLSPEAQDSLEGREVHWTVVSSLVRWILAEVTAEVLRL